MEWLRCINPMFIHAFQKYLIDSCKISFNAAKKSFIVISYLTTLFKPKIFCNPHHTYNMIQSSFTIHYKLVTNI